MHDEVGFNEGRESEADRFMTQAVVMDMLESPACRAICGLLLAAVIANGDQLINIAVFGAAVSYVLLNLSHIVLRLREPGLERAYRTPGGVVTTTIALVLSVVAVIATFVVDPLAAGVTAAIFAAFLAYFWLYSRHHLVANAPEEEFDQLAAAERALR